MIRFAPAPAALPPGQRIYAVGDVHGCAGMLDRLHGLIAGDLRARPVEHATLIHLGDLIDRGPDSAGVVARAIGGPAAPAGQALHRLTLLGNHERMMLDALDGRDPGATGHWFVNGGTASLQSWQADPAEPRDWPRLIPAAHQDFLRGLPLIHQAGGYVFVHAGLRPGVDVAGQAADDLIWIRGPFLSFPGVFGAPGRPVVVVHGHTPQPEPVLRHNRIGIDTGAVMGGRLTCAVLEEDHVGFLQVRPTLHADMTDC